MRTTIPAAAVILACGAVLTTAGCDEGASESQYSTDLEPMQEDAPAQTAQETTEQAEPVSTDVSSTEPPPEPERELVKARESQSVLGKTRDLARDARNDIQGGQEPEGGIADTTSDEHYAQVGSLRWDVDEDWRVAIPADPSIRAELFVPSQFGAGTVVFTEDRAPARNVIRNWESLVIDQIGDPATATTSTRQIAGFDVTLATLDGTYLGDGREKPFYAVRIVVVDRGDGSVVAGVFYGPEATVREQESRWETMVAGMREN